MDGSKSFWPAPMRSSFPDEDWSGLSPDLKRTFACPMCAATESIVAARTQHAQQGECPIEENPDLVWASDFSQCAVKNADTINPIVEGAV
jgi:hypothetical protein